MVVTILDDGSNLTVKMTAGDNIKIIVNDSETPSINRTVRDNYYTIASFRYNEQPAE